MEDTCNKTDCALWGLFDHKCPNYVESWWNSSDNKPKLVHDCAPRRTFIMIQDLHNRLIGVQKAQEETRNEVAQVRWLASVLGKACDMDLTTVIKAQRGLTPPVALKQINDTMVYHTSSE
jgi:hypothetical protein